MLNPDSQALTRKLAFKWISLGVSLCVLWFAAIQDSKPNLSDIIHELYHHSVTIYVTDSTTGNPLDFSVDWPEADEYGYPKDIDAGPIEDANPLGKTISWSGHESIEITIHSNSFKPLTITVGKNTESPQILKLQPDPGAT